MRLECKQALANAYRKNLASRMAETHARLLKAATKVFATAGLTGATTREIARVAAVNEVKLIRLQQNEPCFLFQLRHWVYTT